jgi:deoxyribodipyrimidine photo-lyase
MMAPSGLPDSLSDWQQAPRVRVLNDRMPAANGRYVLCWLQQALRAHDNPVVDAAVRLGNALRLPVLVYHGVREDYPYASDRLQHFILGASLGLAGGCRERGLACVQHIDRADRRQKGLVYRLGVDAAAITLEDQPTFVARWQSERVAARVNVPVFAVNAACLVPPAVIGADVRGRTTFLRIHEPARAVWSAWNDEVAEAAPYAGELPFTPDRLDEVDLGTLIAGLDIDHSLPVTSMHPAGRTAAEDRLARLVADVLPSYASNRNDATRPDGASGLSPYLHFGVLGPREIMAAVNGAPAGAQHKRKFADELLGASGSTIRRSISTCPSDTTGSPAGRVKPWPTMPATPAPTTRRLPPCFGARRGTRRGMPVSGSSWPRVGCTTTCVCTGASGSSR